MPNQQAVNGFDLITAELVLYSDKNLRPEKELLFGLLCRFISVAENQEPTPCG